MNRYTRQIVLPEVGPEGQERLRTAQVLVVGAGGLGVPVLQYLAGAGIGSLTVVDADRVEESNLHRQPLYRMGDIGRAKVEAVAETLQSLNPAVQVRPISEWLDPDLAAELVPAADLVLDCADNFGVSLTLSDACKMAGKPLVAASALGLQGYVAGVCGTAPSLRAIFPELPGNAPTCSAAGILGPVVGMMGMMQAQMALSILLGLSPSPLGQMLILDARQWRFSGFRFDDAPEPVSSFPFIARTAIAAGDLLIDLRTEEPAPFRPDALHLPSSELPTLAIPPGTRRVVLACRTGLRAHNCAEILRPCWHGEIALLSLPGG